MVEGFRVFRESNDAATPASPCQLSMNLILHHRLHYIVDFRATDTQVLQVLLAHGDVVQECKPVNCLLLETLYHLTCHVTQSIDQLIKLLGVRLFQGLDFGHQCFGVLLRVRVDHNEALPVDLALGKLSDL